MAISNLASGFRPGVCTSTTRPTTPFEGQMIYETDTNRVLVYDNAAWVMIADTDTPPGLSFIKKQTVGTTVASVTVSDVFSSTFDSYVVNYAGGVGSVAAAAVRIAFNVDTANNYYSNGQYQTAGITTINALAFGAVTGQITIGYVDTGDFSMNMTVNNPNRALNTSFVNHFTALGSASRVGFISGWSIATGANTGFTLSVSSGTITGGDIFVYGYRNAI